jgi:hypothetical protein
VLKKPSKSRWNSFVGVSGRSGKVRGLEEERNPLHRGRVEYSTATILVHLSDEDGKGWTVMAVDRKTRRWAVAQCSRQVKRKIGFVVILLALVFCTACGGDLTSNTTRNSGKAPQPMLEPTLLESVATLPPASLIEMLRAEMRDAAPAPARERHPASKLVGDGCDETSFAFYETKGDQSQYIGLYHFAYRKH